MEPDTIIAWVIGSAVFSIFLLGSSCSCIQNYQDDSAMVAMVAMVQHGASPVAARCAIHGSSDGVCAMASK